MKGGNVSRYTIHDLLLDLSVLIPGGACPTYSGIVGGPGDTSYQ